MQARGYTCIPVFLSYLRLIRDPSTAGAPMPLAHWSVSGLPVLVVRTFNFMGEPTLPGFSVFTLNLVLEWVDKYWRKGILHFVWGTGYTVISVVCTKLSCPLPNRPHTIPFSHSSGCKLMTILWAPLRYLNKLLFLQWEGNFWIFRLLFS